MLALCAGLTAQAIAQGIPEIKKNSVVRVLLRLHAARAIHISGWVTGSKGPQPRLWSAGDQPDALKPPRSRKAKNCKAHRARARKSGDYEDVLAANRAKNATRYHCGKRDAMTAAFFGGTP